MRGWSPRFADYTTLYLQMILYVHQHCVIPLTPLFMTFQPCPNQLCSESCHYVELYSDSSHPFTFFSHSHQHIELSYQLIQLFSG